jgi:hypothetical protein
MLNVIDRVLVNRRRYHFRVVSEGSATRQDWLHDVTLTGHFEQPLGHVVDQMVCVIGVGIAEPRDT